MVVDVMRTLSEFLVPNSQQQNKEEFQQAIDGFSRDAVWDQLFLLLITLKKFLNNFCIDFESYPWYYSF